jgi:Rps23 Pro-64 3,4-dihydroxylase Tpa1-like proline 4-hydroxylase
MGKGDFLNPHLDNSHDGDQKNYRAINVLYYLSENWPANEASGGRAGTDGARKTFETSK